MADRRTGGSPPDADPEGDGAPSTTPAGAVLAAATPAAAAPAASATAATDHRRAGATRAAGWREVLIVAAAIVGIALGAAVLTGLLPPAGQDVIFRSPLVIVVLLVGTVGLMVRLAVRRPPA